ncbi:hypothetical protein G173_gp251 [Erwinia phage phiEaH2]|uniref:Uncharacterized protein n=1 Tax=Erwinia phage phiEaH2 TaxID=1029988 RepID=J7KCJ6_9CAUD|nr:hypothetical protein G173_gp251 [Erwinia phage phiEaH2]AFQ96796.1 hypothetical protein [Erwinia phage phiEaH2]
MNTIEMAVKAKNEDQLVNAVLYKLSQKFGHQYVSSGFQNLTTRPSGEYVLPEKLQAAKTDNYYGVLVHHIQAALAAQYVGCTVRVSLAQYYRDGDIDPIGFFCVHVEHPDDGQVINFVVYLHPLEAAFHAVDLNRLVEMKTLATRETPIVVLTHDMILEVTGMDYVDGYVIDSVSIAAHAAGWSDTEQYGLSLLLSAIN